MVLNFNRKGDTYKTLIGGAISVMLKALIFAFVLYKSILLVNVKGNSY